MPRKHTRLRQAPDLSGNNRAARRAGLKRRPLAQPAPSIVAAHMWNEDGFCVLHNARCAGFEEARDRDNTAG